LLVRERKKVEEMPLSSGRVKYFSSKSYIASSYSIGVMHVSIDHLKVDKFVTMLNYKYIKSKLKCVIMGKTMNTMRG
jgi:hypothetical protein